MRRDDTKGELQTDGDRQISWFWASVLAVHPLLTTAALAGLLLFALVSTTTLSLQLPDYLPLIPGAVALIFLGVAYLYTPIYLAGLVLDYRQVRKANVGWNPSRRFLLGGSVQLIYFIIPIVQAYEIETFEELVFGAVEVTALFVTGVITIRYLRTRDTNLSGVPTLVALWSRVW